MIRSSLKILLVLIILFFIVEPVMGQVNYESLFNSGINFGWLRTAYANTMFRNSWSTYAYGGTLAYNTAFSPPRNMRTPRADLVSADQSIGYIRTQIHNITGAVHAFNAGVSLAYAHILSQQGGCPRCVLNGVLDAGFNIENLGRVLGNENLRRLGISMQDNAKSADVYKINMASYTSYCANIMSSVQNIL